MSSVLRTRRGAQAVEFALTLPVLLILTAATVDWGWYFHQSMACTQAAVQGNRAAAEAAEADAVAVGEAVAVSVWNAGPGLTDITTNDVVTVLGGTAPERTVTTTVTVPQSCLVCLTVTGNGKTVAGAATTGNTIRHTAVDHFQN